MHKKRTPIDLGKLAEESGPEMRAMLAELVGEEHSTGSVAWSRRFTASGKHTCSMADSE